MKKYIILLFIGISSLVFADALTYQAKAEMNATKSSGKKLIMQSRTDQIALKAKKALKADEVLVMIMDSRSGKVEALSSSNPKSNAFISWVYEPGSIMIPLTIAVALDANVVNGKEQIGLYKESIKVGKFTIRENTYEENKTLDITSVINHSSNVGIVQIIQRFSDSKFFAGLKNFGLGKPTKIDLPHEESGILRNNTKLSSITAAYGYGVSVTPIQLMRAYASLNNGGTLPTPYLHYPPTTLSERVISAQTANLLKKALIKNAQNGRGKNTIVKGLTIGGKMSTSHRISHGHYSDAYNSSFFGFVEDKTGHIYTIGIIIQNPKHKYSASQIVTPLFYTTILAMQDEGLLEKNHTAQKNNQLNLLFTSPLRGCSIAEKYGEHRDSEYNLTVFREGVLLTSPYDLPEVYTIDRGRVSFLGDDPLLGKTIIISHSNSKWQSVYAGLNSINPTLYKGTSVSKNTVLGRVKRKLTFQLLYTDHFVDPEKFINFKDTHKKLK